MASENATALAVREEKAVEVVDAKPCPDETFGVNPQVFPQSPCGRMSPKQCTTEQLFEIVVDIAQGFRKAKEIVAEKREYVLRLKTEVFKVRFGSKGTKVLVTYKDEQGLAVSREMTWSGFCEAQFKVSADWVSRICGEKAGGGRREQAARPESEKPLYKKGYQAAKAELQPQLKAAAERQDALGKRIYGLEGDNQRLRGIADQVQQQFQESVDQAAASLPTQLERLKELATLAAEAFRIINGNFGQRLMGSPDGNRLVEIAKKAAVIKGRIEVC